ncbi:MAG TPA: TonB family protein [Burkholderiales bacterium]|nr:TonB family protein [Burkholderiales bacterium]
MNGLDIATRFQYAVFASLLVHAFIIVGVGVRLPDLSKFDAAAPQMEVVLVNARSASSPLAADRLAQQNLEGGGNTDADLHATTPLPALQDSQTTQLQMQSRRVEQLEAESRRLLAQVKSNTTVPPADSHPQPQPTTRPVPDAADLLAQTFQIARLEAQIEQEQQAYQKRPRRKFIGANTQEYRFTRYLDDWRLKVERIGTLNYPEEAHNLMVTLRLTVSIRADGSIEKIEIDRTSGQKALDDAAIRIVQLGAPYAPFPPDIAKDVDILSITRTWMFGRSDQLMLGQ